MYRVFTRTWWIRNPTWPGGREPGAGPKHTLAKNVETEDEARALCAEYNATHEPGFLSRKAEYEGAVMFPDDRYLVICRLGKTERHDEPAYTLATRQTFATWQDARAYARTVARSRRPLVVSGRFHQLREPAPLVVDEVPCRHPKYYTINEAYGQHRCLTCGFQFTAARRRRKLT